MTSPDRQENHVHPEKKGIHRDARVVFYGMIHSPFNLEGIKPAVGRFEQFLTSSSGRNVLYKESATFTPEVAEMSKHVIEHHGLVDPLLGDILRAHRVTNINQETLDRLRQTINRAGTRAIEIGLVPPTMGQDFFLSYELEKLRSRFPFDVEFESHSENTVREISDRLAEVQSLEGENIDSWMRGRVDRIVENKKKVHQATLNIAEVRYKDIVKDLANITRSLAHDKQNSVLFVMFGGSHASMIETLQQTASTEEQVDYETINAGLSQSPEVVIQQALQARREIPDDVYAQHFLETVLSVTVQTHAMSRRRFTAYVENYETIAKTISAIATSLSLAEIEDIAKSRRDILDFLRAHPLNTPILPYISRLLI